MDIYTLYQNYVECCAQFNVEPMPFQQYKEDFEEDQLEAERQDI